MYLILMLYFYKVNFIYAFANVIIRSMLQLPFRAYYFISTNFK
ncbi:hypothetical protein JCM19296_3393 [Nonlabens ulvanivorans]|uniref:Uncharacterized protein n=1 Tax=Nonlabens ulvanivorans TaxID=906888 RepID=A0A081DFT8_NONUL|nr:hypothetical protein JCM19296_3393 [Nonlabens ulvanivorans]